MSPKSPTVAQVVVFSEIITISEQNYEIVKACINIMLSF